jgi:ATP-dependent RNA circularization protein (DNA/RNA ligase family)
MAGPFIPGVPKTDEIRVQSCLEMIEALRGKPYYVTEKADGTSLTVGKAFGRAWVCSRNGEVREDTNWYWKVTNQYSLLKVCPEDAAIQCELVGPGIQKNRLGLTALEIRVFDLWDLRGGEYWRWDAVQEFCQQHGLPTVRELQRGEAFDLSLEYLLNLADDLYPGTQNRREGIVVRPLVPIRMSTGDRLSFKVLSNSFLLQDEA